jgi:hypothetical protein
VRGSGYEEAYRLAERNGHRRQSVPPPITHSGNELRSRVFPPVRWAIPEMLAEGVTLFGGREKMGKSWLALGLCIATATGGHALGKVPVEQGESLYISLEDNERRLQDRVKTLTGEDTDLGMLHYADGWLRSDEGGQSSSTCSSPSTRIPGWSWWTRSRKSDPTRAAEGICTTWTMRPLSRLSGSRLSTT